ncbi:glycosyltransferase [Rhodohalobacter barkolensis]|uniref:Galactosyltransferase n=1 Tax=Rhodohalobacter barkolensis TaxID=2053187 RepID=A0A2N0VGD6_9BACT|nr:glycosyltransferase [Rhodohalobacter barkolensis]PKD43251.1 galactosyltransferase [Rhodohalobacter barkolensis]
MNRKKVICLVIPTLQSGGMERVMSELAGFFSAKHDTKVHLVLYGKERELFYEVPDGVQIHRPDWTFSDRWRTLHTLKTLMFLRQRVKSVDPDVVLSFGEYWNSFVIISLLGLKVPLFISDRCSPAKNLNTPHELLRKILYPGVSGIISQTSKAEVIYREKGYNKNIRTIGNPVREVDKKGKVPDKENIVLTVGRLISTKHHERLLTIFRNANPGNWKLVIVGGNANKEDGMTRLKKVIEDNGLQEQVILTGKISDVDTYFLKSKIFAFTSSSEGFPNVIGEAMSAGLPVISYNCIAGPSDMIENGVTGYLVDLFDDKTFKDNLEKLMNNESLRQQMGEAGEKKIQANSVSGIGQQIYRFITTTPEPS